MGRVTSYPLLRRNSRGIGRKGECWKAKQEGQGPPRDASRNSPIHGQKLDRQQSWRVCLELSCNENLCNAKSAVHAHFGNSTRLCGWLGTAFLPATACGFLKVHRTQLRRRGRAAQGASPRCGQGLRGPSTQRRRCSDRPSTRGGPHNPPDQILSENSPPTPTPALEQYLFVYLF